ncbi:HlyD family secretion protein [Hufsiella ginkgonis]|uniref:HlyD family efflux transporter periplasmic adaptor subunit n=1 Tax=Hufsiella ginkgonis TaxID=2695274 RepID=A0A7K1XUZ7_9SPHI|nr:efflux RND transporter periplasmic adaptor subunit [Hufsiella ginkgonis]MXV14831.1 HlyD family efflux transporter periplasmic adaptor subunit [Hufsiella ginkgonis]
MKYLPLAVVLLVLASCSRNENQFDASGNFEADEVIVSSELAGKITSFTVEEGQVLKKAQQVGTIDAANLVLQKEQVQESIRALGEKTADVNPQIALLQNQLAVQQSQLGNLQHEQKRTGNLVKQDAATGKQLDDINAAIDVLQKQIAVTRQQINVQKSSIGTQNRSVLSEAAPLQKRVEQIDDQIGRALLTSPINGTVITKYAEEGEITSPGKALYKLADLSSITLRAYLSGSQLSEVKLGQQVKVLVDKGKDAYKEFTGTITWISDKAEFTPKTIQTKDERANLVYAMKVKVANDGYLKIGMYGEIQFQPITNNR